MERNRELRNDQRLQGMSRGNDNDHVNYYRHNTCNHYNNCNYHDNYNHTDNIHKHLV